MSTDAATSPFFVTVTRGGAVEVDRAEFSTIGAARAYAMRWTNRRRVTSTRATIQDSTEAIVGRYGYKDTDDPQEPTPAPSEPGAPVQPETPNPHAAAYAAHAYPPGDRGGWSRMIREIAARDALLRRAGPAVRAGWAHDTFGYADRDRDDAAWRIALASKAEAQARKVDALYRAHLLRAASDLRCYMPWKSPILRQALDNAMGAETQEIRAEHTDGPAIVGRVAVLIHRARTDRTEGPRPRMAELVDRAFGMEV